MLITIQYPITDLRPFIPDEGGRLARPMWPAAEVNNEFVRSFGGVQRRFRGGLPGWVGEGVHCRALNGLRFRAGQPNSISLLALGLDGNGSIPIKVAFRRIYADGLVLVKAEIGFALPERLVRDFRGEGVRLLLHRLLTTELKISSSNKNEREVSLARAGRSLAQAYAEATTSRKQLANIKPQSWWVISGRPILFWESGPIERIHIPFPSRIVPRLETIGVTLSRTDVPTENGILLPLWFMSIDSKSSRSLSYGYARELRICLLRLHAECECLRLTLQRLGSKELQVEARPKRPDAPEPPLRAALQYYLHAATRKINGLSKEADEMSETELSKIARQAIDAINPTTRSDILAALKTIDIRQNILHKVKNFVATQTIIMNDNSIKIFGDVINSQVGQTLTNCTNIINQQNPGERKDLLEKISEQVHQIVKDLPPEKRDEAPQVAENLEMLVKQATSVKPNRRWYSVSADGLLDASKWVKGFAGNIAGTIGELGKLIWPDFSLLGNGEEKAE